MLENLDLDPGLWLFLPHSIKVETSNCTEKENSHSIFGILFFMSPQREREMIVLCNAYFTACFHTKADFLNANRKFEVRFQVFVFPI